MITVENVRSAKAAIELLAEAAEHDSLKDLLITLEHDYIVDRKTHSYKAAIIIFRHDLELDTRTGKIVKRPIGGVEESIRLSPDLYAAVDGIMEELFEVWE